MIFFFIAFVFGLGFGLYQYYLYRDVKDSILATISAWGAGIGIAFLIVAFVSMIVMGYDNYYYTPTETSNLIPIANEYYMTIEKSEGSNSKVYRVFTDEDGLTEKVFNDGDFFFQFDDEAQPSLTEYRSHFKYSWIKLFSFNFRGSCYIVTLPTNSIYINFTMEVLHE